MASRIANVTALDEHSRALLFWYGDFLMVCVQVPSVSTRKLYQKLFVPLGQPAEMLC